MVPMWWGSGGVVLSLVATSQSPPFYNSNTGAARDLILDYFYWGARVLFFTRVLLFGGRGLFMLPCSFIHGMEVYYSVQCTARSAYSASMADLISADDSWRPPAPLIARGFCPEVSA